MLSKVVNIKSMKENIVNNAVTKSIEPVSETSNQFAGIILGTDRFHTYPTVVTPLTVCIVWMLQIFDDEEALLIVAIVVISCLSEQCCKCWFVSGDTRQSVKLVRLAGL